MSEEWKDDEELDAANRWADSVTGSDHCPTGVCMTSALTVGAKLAQIEKKLMRQKRIERLNALPIKAVDITDPDFCPKDYGDER